METSKKDGFFDSAQKSRISDKEVKAIVFDIGGVIYLSKEPEHIFMQKALNLDGQNYKKIVKKFINQASVNKISEKQALKEISQRIKLSPNEIKNIFIREYNKNFYLNKKLLNLIKNLKRNYKISVLSNQFSLSYNILVHKKLPNHFSVLIFSHKVKSRKPSAQIYKIALSELKVHPAQAIFVDDRAHNLIPAQKLGMKTILFKSNKQLIRDLRKLGVKI